jgi:hypothetical protein
MVGGSVINSVAAVLRRSIIQNLPSGETVGDEVETSKTSWMSSGGLFRMLGFEIFCPKSRYQSLRLSSVRVVLVIFSSVEPHQAPRCNVASLTISPLSSP